MDVCVCLCAFCLDTSKKILSTEIKLKLRVRKFCYSIIFQAQRMLYECWWGRKFRIMNKMKDGNTRIENTQVEETLSENNWHHPA